MAGDPSARPPSFLSLFLFSLLYLESSSLAYRPGDNVPMSKAGQYHGVLIPLEKPSGYTGAAAYKMDILALTWDNQFADHFRYSGNDLHGVTAEVVDMPHHYIEVHQDIRKHFWDPERWPKHVLVRYTWEEWLEIDVAGGFYVLFGSGLVLSFILAIYVLQSSQDKLARFVRETVAESSVPGGVAKVE